MCEKLGSKGYVQYIQREYSFPDLAGASSTKHDQIRPKVEVMVNNPSELSKFNVTRKTYGVVKEDDVAGGVGFVN